MGTCKKRFCDVESESECTVIESGNNTDTGTEEEAEADAGLVSDSEHCI